METIRHRSSGNHDSRILLREQKGDCANALIQGSPRDSWCRAMSIPNMDICMSTLRAWLYPLLELQHLDQQTRHDAAQGKRSACCTVAMLLSRPRPRGSPFRARAVGSDLFGLLLC